MATFKNAVYCIHNTHMTHMTDTPKFQRAVEDFVCEHCGVAVAGNGYTNHCPNCLWSKHVDVNPGDRASTCCELMEPTAVEQKQGEYRVLQACTGCDHVRWNKILEQDSFETLLTIARNQE